MEESKRLLPTDAFLLRHHLETLDFTMKGVTLPWWAGSLINTLNIKNQFGFFYSHKNNLLSKCEKTVKVCIISYNWNTRRWTLKWCYEQIRRITKDPSSFYDFFSVYIDRWLYCLYNYIQRRQHAV